MSPDKRNIHEFIRDKRKWEEPPPVPEAADSSQANFRGWYTRGYLPHCDKPGLLQMITYRLADAMPASRRHEWAALLKIKDERHRRIEIESYLDQGQGECVLKNVRLAEVVERALLHFDGERYRLVAWAVMPNHVHFLFETWQVPLPKLLQSWKGFTARECNALLGRAGTFWQEDFFDTYVRDENHFQQVVRYIERNPVNAGLVRQPEDWSFSSANLKWEWADGDRHARYRGAHLNHSNWNRADRNVRAPDHIEL